MRWKPQILQNYDSDIKIEDEPEAAELDPNKSTAELGSVVTEIE
jgi:hypothetical protein